MKSEKILRKHLLLRLGLSLDEKVIDPDFLITLDNFEDFMSAMSEIYKYPVEIYNFKNDEDVKSLIAESKIIIADFERLCEKKLNGEYIHKVITDEDLKPFIKIMQKNYDLLKDKLKELVQYSVENDKLIRMYPVDLYD